MVDVAVTAATVMQHTATVVAMGAEATAMGVEVTATGATAMAAVTPVFPDQLCTAVAVVGINSSTPMPYRLLQPI